MCRKYLKNKSKITTYVYILCMYVCTVGMRPEFWVAFQEKYRVERIVEFYAATEGNVFLVNCYDKVGTYTPTMI